MEFENKYDTTEINSYCETPLDVLKSEDFKKGLKILLKYNKNFDSEYILGIFDKVSRKERLPDDDADYLYFFLGNESIEKTGKKILQKSNMTIDIKGTENISVDVKGTENISVDMRRNDLDGFINFMTLLKTIFSEQGYDILKNTVKGIVDKSNSIILDNNKEPLHKEILIFGETNERDDEIIEDWKFNKPELYNLLEEGIIKFTENFIIIDGLTFERDDLDGRKRFSELKKEGFLNKVPQKKDFEKAINHFKGNEGEFKKLLNLKDGYYWAIKKNNFTKENTACVLISKIGKIFGCSSSESNSFNTRLLG